MYYRSVAGIKNCSNRSFACRRDVDEDGHARVGGISDGEREREREEGGDGGKDKYGKINLSGILAAEKWEDKFKKAARPLRSRESGRITELSNEPGDKGYN